jgi:hypothetical protein
MKGIAPIGRAGKDSKANTSIKFINGKTTTICDRFQNF